jgi:hypothetical protein
MGNLEKRFHRFKHRTLTDPEDPSSEQIREVLKNAIVKGNYILKNGPQTKYYFNFDLIYSSRASPL